MDEWDIAVPLNIRPKGKHCPEVGIFNLSSALVTAEMWYVKNGMLRVQERPALCTLPSLLPSCPTDPAVFTYYSSIHCRLIYEP
jgi:hypothetical protein